MHVDASNKLVCTIDGSICMHNNGLHNGIKCVTHDAVPSQIIVQASLVFGVALQGPIYITKLQESVCHIVNRARRCCIVAWLWHVKLQKLYAFVEHYLEQRSQSNADTRQYLVQQEHSCLGLLPLKPQAMIEGITFYSPHGVVKGSMVK